MPVWMNWLNRGDSAVPATIISIALMLAAGFLMTRITKKLRLPNVTAYIVGGILAGLLAAFTCNKFYKQVLPQSLAFFSGTRFVPRRWENTMTVSRPRARAVSRSRSIISIPTATVTALRPRCR